QDSRLSELPLHRTHHAGRCFLPHLQPDRFGRHPIRRAQALNHRQAIMNDMTSSPLSPIASDTQEPMVRFSGVTKRYGDLTVLDNLDLDVAPQEKVAIIGPSGSGKTTVLRMLMTLEPI